MDQTTHGAIADGHQKSLVGNGRQPQHAIQRVAQVQTRKLIAQECRWRHAFHYATHPRRLTEQGLDGHVHRFIAQQ